MKSNYYYTALPACFLTAKEIRYLYNPEKYLI